MFASLKADYPKNNYQIFISDNLINNLSDYLKNYDKKSVVIIADSFFKKNLNISGIDLSKIFNNYNTLFIKGGVASKDISAAINICEKLSNDNIARDGCIVAIGGGVIGDICGLAASLYKRGIPLIHVPTTMTAAVDSAIGGKTGVNMHEGVNMLGTYYHPVSTFIDLRFLISLPDRDFSAGIAESIKKSFIYDKFFYEFMLNNSKKILAKNLESIYEVIYKSISIKLFHTISDEKEKSTRLLLNYGHTFGQAFESTYGINEKKLRHGEAVSLGMMCAAQLSEKKYDNNYIFRQHKDILKEFNLPIKLSECNNLVMPKINNLILRLDKDKKKTFKGNRFIICKKLGKAHAEYVEDINIIKESFQAVLS
tara:strand:- start:4906 stop:6009 length:1104 start_codon:yes stop_codon:yes gene_type:complete